MKGRAFLAVAPRFLNMKLLEDCSWFLWESTILRSSQKSRAFPTILIAHHSISNCRLALLVIIPIGRLLSGLLKFKKQIINGSNT